MRGETHFSQGDHCFGDGLIQVMCAAHGWRGGEPASGRLSCDLVDVGAVEGGFQLFFELRIRLGGGSRGLVPGTGAAATRRCGVGAVNEACCREDLKVVARRVGMQLHRSGDFLNGEWLFGSPEGIENRPP